MIKFVALDVDGTLVDKDLKIPPRTVEAVRAARARGVRFAIVTGRMHQSGVPFARELGLEGMPLVSYNGGMVKDYPSGKLIYHNPVPVEIGLKLAHFCEARGYYLQAYVNDELYVPDLGEEAQYYMKIARVEAHPVGPISKWLTEGSTKLLILDDPSRTAKIREEVIELLGPTVHVHTSYPEFLEVVNADVSKGNALAAIAETFGLDRSQVMAIGDAMNDLPMITWAGTSFAMPQAPEALRKAATYVCEQGPGHGVAEALERLGLIG